MRLTLLRSATFPNAMDRGRHEFTYALYPHRGVWQDSSLLSHACDLNNPMEGVCNGLGDSGALKEHSLISCDTSGICIEAIKQSESGDALVVRVYEGHGRRSKASFILDRERDIDECDMLESPARLLFEKAKEFELIFQPFEIKTLRLRI